MTDTDQSREVLLLLVEEAVEDDTWARRERFSQAFMPVPDVPDADIVESLRAAMGNEGIGDPQMARYHRVCIVAFPSSRVRTWAAAFFAAEVAWLIDAGGLSWCVPPFDARHTVLVTPTEAAGLAGEWDRLRPPEPQPSPLPPPPRRHPGSGRPGTGGWWSGPEVVVRAADPQVCHLRVSAGRRSFCGLRAKDLEWPEPAIRYEDVPDDRRCPDCTQQWFEEIRPQRERDRREVDRRLEAVTGLLRAFDHFDAINDAVANAPDWPTAHAVLTAPPFGYTDLQAFHILTFPVGHQTPEGRADLEAQEAGLRSWSAKLEAFFAQARDGSPMAAGGLV